MDWLTDNNKIEEKTETKKARVKPKNQLPAWLIEEAGRDGTSIKEITSGRQVSAYKIPNRDHNIQIPVEVAEFLKDQKAPFRKGVQALLYWAMIELQRQNKTLAIDMSKLEL